MSAAARGTIPPRKAGRSWLFRIPAGSDLWEGLTAFCAKRRIECAAIQVIGATTEACVGYYDQKKHRYYKKTFQEEMEILSCLGNASLKDGKPFLHLHASLGDTRLRAWGGHLFPGTKIFSAEAHLQELKGPRLVRRPDAATGLALWPECPIDS